MPKNNSQKFNELYKNLNTEQKQAVDAIEGPVMVIAGPGTGKTQVLTMRVANILLQTDTPPDGILALTFTESGVRAMRDRLLSIIGTQAYYVNINTFHSFASDIIRANADEFIISTQLEPLSDLERIHIFKEIFDQLNLKAIKPFNSPYYYLQTAISKIQDLKREGIDTKEYKNYIEQAEERMEEKDVDKNKELLKIYELYQDKLKEYGRYDFEDMINFVIDRFKTSPTLLSKYQERFQYFLVDEFQDTNSAQAELLYQLTSYWGEQANIFVVGDDDQSIYRFQGASIENIIDFNNKYPNAKKVALKRNYRSFQPILDAAQEVISNNDLRISNEIKINKDQIAHNETKDKQVIKTGEFSSSHTENHYIASQIKKLIESGVEGSEIAVIYRNNSDSIDIADMLARFGIEYTLEGGENVLDSGVIVRLMHLLRVVHKCKNLNEDLDMFTLLNYEFLDFSNLDILKFSRFASKRKINFFEAINRKDLDKAELDSPELFKDFAQKIAEWNELEANKTFIDFVEIVMDESGYLNWILNHDLSYEYLNKLNSFLSEIKRLNHSNKQLSLDSFLSYINLMKENRIGIKEETLDLETNAVKLTTAHRSKGLEFEYVFVPKFIDKKWSNTINRELIKLPPSILKTVDLADKKVAKKIQEEDDRRLFFVVLTRAKKQVAITSAKHYQSAGYSRDGTPSMFLYELPEEFKDSVNIVRYEKDAAEILKSLLKPKIKKEVATADEDSFLNKALRNFKISASSLNTYLDCAYKFKLDYLFRTPMPSEKPLVLGSAVHAALEIAHKNVLEQKSVDYKLLGNAFTMALEKEILTKDELDQIKEEGLSLLKVYFDKYENEFKDAGNTLFLEKFLGWGWSKPLLDGEIHLQGKIDKIDSVDQENRTVKVTDYKTGRPKSRNEILGKTKYANMNQYRQLLFYKLLVDLDSSFNYTVSQVELDYIGNRSYKPKREEFEITEEDLTDLKDTIREVSQNIKNLKFERTTDYSICQMCRYKNHCWPDGIPASSQEQLSFLSE